MNMNIIAITMLQTYKPVSTIFSKTFGFLYAPFFELFGLSGYDYAIILGKKKNLEKIINKLKEDN